MEDPAQSTRQTPSPLSGLKPPANLDIAGARKGVGCNLTGGVAGDVTEGNYNLSLTVPTLNPPLHMVGDKNCQKNRERAGTGLKL